MRLNFSERKRPEALLGRPLPFVLITRDNETSGIVDQLKVTSEAFDFIIEILAFLAYGGSSFVKTLK
jgi:hypothetical protein